MPRTSTRSRRPVTAQVGYTYCVSDTHVHPPDPSGMLDRVFTQKKASTLALIARMAATGKGRGRLVLVGDVFDITGSTPPAQGLVEFFDTVLGAGHGLGNVVAKTPSQLLWDMADGYPDLFSAFAELLLCGDVVFLKGNHDCAVFDPAVETTLAQLLEAEGYGLRFETDPFPIPPYLFTHGHEYDPSNRTDGGCANRGSVITSALYHAVMPALRKLGVREEIVKAIPAVRPEEGILDGLAVALKERAPTFLRGFVHLLVLNGYWGNDEPQFIRDILADVAREIATVQRIRDAMSDDTGLKNRLRDEALTLQASATRGGLDVRTVVMGHTHDRDSAPCYLNLGSWVDFVSGMRDEQLKNPTVELPVLRIAPDASATLFDANDLLRLRTLDECPVLWSSTTYPGGLKAPPPQAVPVPPCIVPGRAKARKASPSPVEASKDHRGYSYVETSDSWKEMCRALPCFAAMQWPDYATKVVETKVDGQEVVVQLWKGWCQQFLALPSFPGGIGAEVGIYRRIPGKQLPEDLSFIDPALRPLMIATGKAGGDTFWWPSPDLEAILGFALVHPVTGETFFTADPEKTYWLNRWMSTGSYDEFKKQNPGKFPDWAVNWKLVYTINGEEQEPW